MSDFLKLDGRDNVRVALKSVAEGARVDVADGWVSLPDAVSLAHKIADCAIASGDPIIKYGMPIGVATQDISAGAPVHVHNMKSNYTATHFRKEELDTKGGSA